MDALRVRSRFRVTAVVEWIVAALFLTATVGVATMILGVLNPHQIVRATPPARPLVSTVPEAVPSGAVSVPLLPFLDGKDVRIGETVSAVATRLGRAAESGRQEIDRGSLGERLTRFYEYSGSRFILVFEPFERNGEPRVAAIYLP